MPKNKEIEGYEHLVDLISDEGIREFSAYFYQIIKNSSHNEKDVEERTRQFEASGKSRWDMKHDDLYDKNKLKETFKEVVMEVANRKFGAELAQDNLKTYERHENFRRSQQTVSP